MLQSLWVVVVMRCESISVGVRFEDCLQVCATYRRPLEFQPIHKQTARTPQKHLLFLVMSMGAVTIITQSSVRIPRHHSHAQTTVSGKAARVTYGDKLRWKTKTMGKNYPRNTTPVELQRKTPGEKLP